jgi:ribosomal protein S18 acetylase RimI-like enzyme
MPLSTDKLYNVQRRDIPEASVTLADAFHYDTVWKLFFKDEATIDQKANLFQVPLLFCLRYGKIYAISEKLEGVAAWVPGRLSDMTIVRLLKSGVIFSGIKALGACTKLAQKQGKIFKPLEEDRKANMKGRAYIYLMVIGVKTDFQGQGFGRKLIAGLINESEQAGIPIYTETQTERNVRFYERLGFRQIKEIILPIIHKPQWELIREPEV